MLMSRFKIVLPLIATLLLVTALLAGMAPTRASAASQDLPFPPQADSYVIATSPSSNYGSATILRTDNSPVTESYLRFAVTGLNGRPVTAASLSIYANSSSTSGVVVKAVADNSWGETAVNFNNAPAQGATLASIPTVTGGTWMVFNVTAYVNGEGLFSFGLSTPGATNISLASRESGSFSPKLTVTVTDSAASPTATTAAQTQTATIAPTLTSIAPSPTATLLGQPKPSRTPRRTPTRTPTSVPPTQTPIGPTATRTPTSVPPSQTPIGPTPTRTPTTVPPTATRTPTSVPPTATSIPSGDPVLVGAGDIASCGSSGDEATANLLDGIAGTVFTAGDNAYESGSPSEYTNCYNPSWGRFKARTLPDPGNHEYNTAGGSGYYGYFGPAAGDPSKGYYSTNLGAWHIIVLNGEINHAAGSPQETWLRQDLAQNPVACTLAIWHEPLFSSGSTHGSNPGFRALWQALYDYHADVVVNGHEHNYERFAPQAPSGAADALGLREFVAGMGGKSHYPFGTILPNSQVRNNDTYGVLKFTLHDSSYDWQFVHEAGKTFNDSGSAPCNP
jgi:hypothetical protein